MLTSAVISGLTEEIWSTLVADQEPLGLAGDFPGEDVLASAEIRGEWNGVVCLSCSHSVARRVTSLMFDVSDGEITADEITDAVGELANVLTGGIKSLVPGPSVLSLPEVQHGGTKAIPGHLDLAVEAQFFWMAEPIVVRVWAEID
jgi:chemotaxis protein CheX